MALEHLSAQAPPADVAAAVLRDGAAIVDRVLAALPMVLGLCDGVLGEHATTYQLHHFGDTRDPIEALHPERTSRGFGIAEP
jgi:hypothetical protein